MQMRTSLNQVCSIFVSKFETIASLRIDHNAMKSMCILLGNMRFLFHFWIYWSQTMVGELYLCVNLQQHTVGSML